MPYKIIQKKRIDLTGGAWIDIRGLNTLELASVFEEAKTETSPEAQGMRLAIAVCRKGVVSGGGFETDEGAIPDEKINGEWLVNENGLDTLVLQVHNEILLLSRMNKQEKKS